jgi:hypothetical protein
MDETLSDDEDERELLDPYEHPDNKRLLQLGRDLDADVSDTESTCSTLSRASSSEASSMSLASSTGIPVGVASAADFQVEARLTLERNINENHSVSDTILELKTLMLSSNVGISGPGGGREAVVACLMGYVDVAKGAKEVKLKSEEVWTKWGGILAGLNATGRSLNERRLTFGTLSAILCAQPIIRTLLPLFPQRALYGRRGRVVPRDRLVPIRSSPRTWRRCRSGR